MDHRLWSKWSFCSSFSDKWSFEDLQRKWPDDRIHKKLLSILFGHPLGTLLASCCKLNCHNWHLIKIVILVSSIITQCEKKVMTSWWVSHNWLGESEFGDDYWSNNSDNWKSDYERLTHPKLDSSGNREITKIQKYREKYWIELQNKKWFDVPEKRIITE